MKAAINVVYGQTFCVVLDLEARKMQDLDGRRFLLMIAENCLNQAMCSRVGVPMSSPWKAIVSIYKGETWVVVGKDPKKLEIPEL